MRRNCVRPRALAPDFITKRSGRTAKRPPSPRKQAPGRWPFSRLALEQQVGQRLHAITDTDEPARLQLLALSPNPCRRPPAPGAPGQPAGRPQHHHVAGGSGFGEKQRSQEGLEEAGGARPLSSIAHTMSITPVEPTTARVRSATSSSNGVTIRHGFPLPARPSRSMRIPECGVTRRSMLARFHRV